MADDELGAFYAQDLQANGVATNLTHTQAQPGQTGEVPLGEGGEEGDLGEGGQVLGGSSRHGPEP